MSGTVDRGQFPEWKKVRRPTQIAVVSTSYAPRIFALCDDGSIWSKQILSDVQTPWVQLPPIQP
jgi:hypothetical protein